MFRGEPIEFFDKGADHFGRLGDQLAYFRDFHAVVTAVDDGLKLGFAGFPPCVSAQAVFRLPRLRGALDEIKLRDTPLSPGRHRNLSAVLQGFVCKNAQWHETSTIAIPILADMQVIQRRLRLYFSVAFEMFHPHWSSAGTTVAGRGGKGPLPQSRQII